MWVTELITVMSKPLRWWVLVAPWEQAVRTRGKWVKKLPPGIHLRVPFLDRVTRTSTRERIVETDNRTCITNDLKSVTFSLGLHYSIDDLAKMVGTVVRPEGTLRLLASARALKYIEDCDLASISTGDIEHAVQGEIESTAAKWGLSRVTCYVTTFVEARPYRILQAKDNGYSSSFDHALDERPVDTK